LQTAHRFLGVHGVLGLLLVTGGAPAAAPPVTGRIPVLVAGANVTATVAVAPAIIPAPANPLPGKWIVSDIIIQGSTRVPPGNIVLIKGSARVPPENIKNQMKTCVRKEYVAETLQDDILRLFGTKQFANVWADQVEDGPGRVKVFIYITDYPSVLQMSPETWKGIGSFLLSGLRLVLSYRGSIVLNERNFDLPSERDNPPSAPAAPTSSGER
jgi:hypothetical protein